MFWSFPIIHLGVDLYCLTFLVIKGSNQFGDSSLSSAMENSYSFSLLGCPSLFILLSSSGSMGSLCTLFFLLMLPHGASFPHVLGNFTEFTFKQGLCFCWRPVCQSCQNIPSALAGVAQWLDHLPVPKGCGFDFLLGHIPRLRVHPQSRRWCMRPLVQTCMILVLA